MTGEGGCTIEMRPRQSLPLLITTKEVLGFGVIGGDWPVGPVAVGRL